MSARDRGHRVGCPGLPEFKGICDCGAALVAEYGAALWRMAAQEPIIDWGKVPLGRMPILRDLVRGDAVVSGRERLGE